MAWRPYRGKFGLRHYSVTTSQVFTQGAMCDVVDGLITVFTITRAPHTGVIQKTVVATDSDYATARRIPLMIPKSVGASWEVSVLSTDTAVATDVGNFFDVGGSPVGIDVTRATSADDAFVVEEFKNANLVAGVLNSYKGQQPGIGTAT